MPHPSCNLSLSLRKTSQALKDLYNIQISHQQIANYCKSAAICIKPFVDNYDYGAGTTFTADETYIKVRGIKSYIWFIMDAAKRSIIGYRVSDNRGVGPCIMAMRMHSATLRSFPKTSALLPMAIVRILLPPSSSFMNSAMLLSSTSPRSSGLPMMTPSPKNSGLLNR